MPLFRGQPGHDDGGEQEEQDADGAGAHVTVPEQGSRRGDDYEDRQSEQQDSGDLRGPLLGAFLDACIAETPKDDRRRQQLDQAVAAES